MRIDGQASPVEFLPAAPLDKDPGADSSKMRAQVDNVKMPGVESVQNAVAFSNSVMKLTNYHIEFQIHDSGNRYQVRMVDNESGEIIREIPPDYMMKIAEHLQGKIQAEAGLLIDKIA